VVMADVDDDGAADLLLSGGAGGVEWVRR
jgi:hypothetical protein